MLKTLLAGALALALAGCAHAPAPVYAVKGPIEARYQAKGPWAVSKLVTDEPCDRENRLCEIWYPTDLGRNPLKGQARGFKHPLISWANGSGQKPMVYAYFLEHLASWGFIVVAAQDESTRDGATTLDAAEYLLKQGRTPSSRFYGKVDASNVGAVGHSQGGAAITSLHAHGNGLFKAYVGFHTAPSWFARVCCNVTPDSYVGSEVTAPILQWSSRPDSGRPDWYEPVPASAPKAYALLTYTHHPDIAATPGCTNQPCGQGVEPYLGYSTAWLMWRLQGVNEAGVAFGQKGEFMRPNPSWSLNLSNIP